MPCDKQSGKQIPWQHSADVWKPTCSLNGFPPCVFFFNSYDFLSIHPTPNPTPFPSFSALSIKLMESYAIKVDIIIIIISTDSLPHVVRAVKTLCVSSLYCVCAVEMIYEHRFDCANCCWFSFHLTLLMCLQAAKGDRVFLSCDGLLVAPVHG